MQDTIVIGGYISLESRIQGDCELDSFVDGETGVFFPLYPDPYAGPVVVTPSEETQILYTADKSMNSDVTVNPIPSNYGRIVYNGVTLTVY